MFKYITAFSLYSIMGKMLLINMLTANMLIDGRDKIPGNKLIVSLSSSKAIPATSCDLSHMPSLNPRSRRSCLFLYELI